MVFVFSCAVSEARRSVERGWTNRNDQGHAQSAVCSLLQSAVPFRRGFFVCLLLQMVLALISVCGKGSISSVGVLRCGRLEQRSGKARFDWRDDHHAERGGDGAGTKAYSSAASSVSSRTGSRSHWHRGRRSAGAPHHRHHWSARLQERVCDVFCLTCFFVFFFLPLAERLDKKDLFGKSDPFLVISRCKEDGVYVPVFKSEVIRKELNPRWKLFEISLQQLCNGDLHRPLRFEVFDWNRRSLGIFFSFFIVFAYFFSQWKARVYRIVQHQCGRFAECEWKQALWSDQSGVEAKEEKLHQLWNCGD